MPKTFEDEFTKSQIDMVSICFEYANYDVEKIYIYGFLKMVCFFAITSLK